MGILGGDSIMDMGYNGGLDVEGVVKSNAFALLQMALIIVILLLVAFQFGWLDALLKKDAKDAKAAGERFGATMGRPIGAEHMVGGWNGNGSANATLPYVALGDSINPISRSGSSEHYVVDQQNDWRLGRVGPEDCPLSKDEYELAQNVNDNAVIDWLYKEPSDVLSGTNAMSEHLHINRTLGETQGERMSNQPRNYISKRV
jgi:hypothetical protein